MRLQVNIEWPTIYSCQAISKHVPTKLYKSKDFFLLFPAGIPNILLIFRIPRIRTRRDPAMPTKNKMEDG